MVPGFRTVTVTDNHALLRSGPPDFKSTGEKVPAGTRVEILAEETHGRTRFVQVKDHDSGKELGWTSLGNTADLDKKYAASKPSYVYNVDGHDLLVFVPPGGIKQATVNVFVFYHGRGADYASSKTHAKNGGFEDNAAIGAKIPEAVANTGTIAICPQGHGFKVDQDWGSIGAGGMKKMVDGALAHLSADLGHTEQPLTPGHISLAGHSAGGNALGQAALEMPDNVFDVTLQEAGYGFERSWVKLREWFLTGKPVKHIRVITQNNGAGAATRKPVAEKRKGEKHGAALSTDMIKSYSAELAKDGKLPGPVTIEPISGSDQVEEGGIVLERGYKVLRSDGTLQGTMRLYHVEDAKADHWAVSDQTMEISMKPGQ